MLLVNAVVAAVAAPRFISMYVYFTNNDCSRFLTHGGLNQMADILLTKFERHFRDFFHIIFSAKFAESIPNDQIGSDNGLVPNTRQAIARTGDNSDLCRHMDAMC